MRLFIKSTEPSNGPFGRGATRYAPTNKLRAMAAAGMGEMQAEQLAVQRMMRLTEETAEPPRHVVVPEDITRGLGLNQDDASRIQKAVTETNVEFTTKTQTHRLTLAKSRLVEIMRGMPISGDMRMEIAKRADSWWRKSVDTALNRSRTIHFISFPLSSPKLMLRG